MTNTGWNWPARDRQQEALPPAFAAIMATLYSLLGTGWMAFGAREGCDHESVRGGQRTWCEIAARDHHWIALLVVPVALSVLVAVRARPEHRYLLWLLIGAADLAFVGIGFLVLGDAGRPDYYEG